MKCNFPPFTLPQLNYKFSNYNFLHQQHFFKFLQIKKETYQPVCRLDLLNCLLSSIVNIIQGQYCLFFSCFFSASCFLYRSAVDASPRFLKMNPFASVESVNCCVATGLLTFIPKTISFCTCLHTTGCAFPGFCYSAWLEE